MERMPFNYCNLSLKPTSDAYCASETILESDKEKMIAPAIRQFGMVFDILSIVPFIKQHGVNPITGKELKQSDLFKLNFHKNEEGKFHCPVTYKLLTNQAHIIAIKESGNVYSYEAYLELNKQAKNYRDLLSD